MPIWIPLLLLAALPAAPAATPPKPVPVSVPVRDPAVLRGELALRINGERDRAGLPPVAPSAALDKVAQARAEEIQAKGALPGEAEAAELFARIQLSMARAGYAAHGWAESQVGTVGGPDAVIASWKADPSIGQAMDSHYQDLGIGIADLHGVPFYVFLFAWPRSQYFARQTAGLADIQAVREAMLAVVNAARQVEGSPPLTLDSRLSAAAQAHAQDMLARTYYAHQSLEGSMPRQRVRAAGVNADLVAENLAAGQTSVENVIDAWLHSVDHRRNMLDPRFTHLGVGVAVGSENHKYKVLWVQDFTSDPH